MYRALGICVLLLPLAATPACGQGGSGGVLGICFAKIQDDKLLLEVPVTVVVEEVRTVTKNIDGKEAEVKEVVQRVRTEMVTHVHAVKACNAFSGDGKIMSAAAMAARLKTPVKILVLHGFLPVMKAGSTTWEEAPFRGLLRDDAIVLVLPPHKSPPADKKPAPTPRS